MIILGLPRSRTAWISSWLSDDSGVCMHEGINGCGSMQDYKKKFNNPVIADSTTAIPFVAGLDIPKIAIIRDAEGSYESMKRLGFNLPYDFFDNLHRQLINIDAVKIDFSDLNEKLPEIWKLVKKTKFPKVRTELYKKMNIQLKYPFEMDIDASNKLVSNMYGGA